MKSVQELLSTLGEPVMGKWFLLVSKMYETGDMPSDFQEKVIMPEQKKSGPNKSEYNRTSSLLSYAINILIKIITEELKNNWNVKLVRITSVLEEMWGSRKLY